jgi:hypothetical protein
MATLPLSEMPTPRPRRFVRHWKERFTKGMPLVFTKRVRLDANRICEPGTPVTDEMRAELGEHRLRLWWTARVVGSATHAIAVGIRTKLDAPECGIKLGDDKTITDAKEKFDSKVNFGGKPFAPGGVAQKPKTPIIAEGKGKKH